MEILRLPALTDNYVFVLHNLEQQIAAVVDPTLAEPVLDCLGPLGVPLVAIFNTHHHHDHVGGNLKLLSHYPQAVVYGGLQDQGRIPGQQVFLEDGDQVRFGDRVADVFFLPGHTRGHIVYYFPPVIPSEWGELFCGDVLFAGGCGRLREGTPAEMFNSLSRLRQLPDQTRIWCAHEYTLRNLEFALTIEPGNLDLQQRFRRVLTCRQQDQPTIPSPLGLEKQTNPFLRWDSPEVQAAVKSQEPVQTFARLRGMKDQF